jgi:hypothetical protein
VSNTQYRIQNYVLKEVNNISCIVTNRCGFESYKYVCFYLFLLITCHCLGSKTVGPGSRSRRFRSDYEIWRGGLLRFFIEGVSHAQDRACKPLQKKVGLHSWFYFLSIVITDKVFDRPYYPTKYNKKALTKVLKVSMSKSYDYLWHNYIRNAIIKILSPSIHHYPSYIV